MSQQITIPPTGRITLTLDWAADLEVPPRCGSTLGAVAWTLPTGITELASAINGTKAEVTIATNALKLNGTFNLVCAATLSNGDILSASVVCVAAYRTTRRSAEVCPAP